MKKTKIAYWIVTSLFAAFMLFSAVPDAISSADAVAFITKMGFPAYIIPFLGVAKILGALAIVIPGFPRLKEWAYAGLVFDLVGAMYSFIALKYPASGWGFMLVFIAIAFVSYFLYHKVQKSSLQVSAQRA